MSYVALTGITAQQAILQYQAVDNNACSVEVSQSPTFSPVEYDVDGTKFTGSSIDSRGLPGAISNGLSRTMIIGRRIAMIGNDGVRYSRSLEADATEYYRIICGLGTALSTGSFHTQTIPFGLAYLEPTLTDANLPGVDASPTTPWDRTTKIIDPRTGFAAHRLNLYSDAGDGPATNTGTNISWSSSTWSNPNNIQTGTAATVSGSSGLLIGHATILNPQNVGMTTDLNPYGSDSGHYKTTVTWIRVTVTAAVNVGGSAPSNANATLNLCVAMTSQTACDASSKTFSQVLTTAYAPYTFGSNTPGDFLRATFTVGIPTWAQQATNQINVILWKATTSTDTIYVDNVSIQYATGAGISGTDGGGYILSTSQPITGPDGEAGYFVMPNGNLAALAYFVGGTTGRTYFEGSAASGFNAGNTCATSQSLVPYQANNPLNYFCLRADGTIWRAVITPANTGNPYAQWQTGTGGATPAVPGPNTGFTLPFCNGSNAPCATLTAINQASNSTDLVSLLTSYTQAPYPSPAFNPTQFPSSGIYIDSLDATTSVILMHIALGGRTSSSSFGYPAWNFVFDPNLVGTSPGCVGAVSSGSAGCIIAAMPVWTRIGCRWCGEKQNIPIAPSYENIFSYYGGLGYQVQTISADGSLTQLSATPSTHCTASGYTAMYCDQITVSSEPYCTGSAGYSCMNTGAAGEAGSLQVGDYISNSSGCGQSSACEAMKIISKTASATANAWILVVVRGWNANIYATGALPVLYTMCNMNQNVTINNGAGGYVFWDYTDYPSGVGTGAINAMPFITGTHVAQGNGQWISACAQFDARCGYGGFGWLSATSAAAGAFSSRISQSVAPSITNEFFTFNGSTNAGVAVVQIHLSASPTTNYGYDAHPYQGTYQSTPPTCNTVSGYLCKFSAASPPFGLSLPFQKVSPILANTVANPLLNISGTGSVIGTTSADNYKFCIVSVSGECYTGSVQNEVYVNMPTPTYNYNVTLTNTNSAANQTDIEIQDAGHYIESIVEVAMTPQCYSCGSRTLTKMTGRIKGTSTFNNATPLWNGQWLMFQSTLMGDGGGQNPFFIGRIPSHAADNINRTTWIPQTITVPKCPLSSGVSAAIRFGYAENGTVASGTLRASARAENTIANATTTTMTGDGANPFWYETSETWSPVSCSSGCTITMNLLPQRAAYYQIVYYNSGSIVYTTSVNVILTP